MYFITPHAALRAMQRGISLEDIGRCLCCGKRVIMYPSGICECRIKAKKADARITVILDRGRRVIITVYRSKRRSRRKS